MVIEWYKEEASETQVYIAGISFTSESNISINGIQFGQATMDSNCPHKPSIEAPSTDVQDPWPKIFRSLWTHLVLKELNICFQN